MGRLYVLLAKHYLDAEPLDNTMKGYTLVTLGIAIFPAQKGCALTLDCQP